MKFDDIGSFPLPEGITRDQAERMAEDNDIEYSRMVEKAFLMKIKSGVEVVNYPQFRNMVSQFMNVIEKEKFWEEPFVIRKKHAEIVEVKAIRNLDFDGEFRVCVTGPFELCYSKFGSADFPDIIIALSKSLRRFVESSMEAVEVGVVSVDEPSLGTNPEVQPDEELIKEAMRAFKFNNAVVQIHLHSPVFYSQFLDVNSVDVVGIEAASSPEVLEFIEREEIESAGKGLRIGIARSDIDSLIAEYNSRYGVNLWKEKEKISSAVNELENPGIIEKRLETAYEKFDDLIEFIGPDCGLGSWPTQESAVRLLKNVRKAVDSFRNKNKNGKH